MNEHQFIGAYRRQQVETASQGQLIVMLYDAGLRNCRVAQDHLSRGERDQAARHLLRAQDIIAELMASLNLEAGGEIGVRLLRLYEYMYRRLVEANVRKDPTPAKEVEGLLAGLRDAWARVATASPSPTATSTAGPTA